MAAIFQTTFSNGFSWTKMYEFRLNFTEVCSNWQYSNIGSDNGLVPTRQHAIIWTNDGCFTDASVGPSELTHIRARKRYHIHCLCRTLWFIDVLTSVNSLRPSDAYMRRWQNHNWFRLWLVAWPAPSHYLNQWWKIVDWTLRNKLPWNFNRNSNIFIQENAFENVVCKMASILSRPQWVKRKWNQDRDE